MVNQILDQIMAAGFNVESDGLELKISGPPDRMTPELRRKITANRDLLIGQAVKVMPDRAELFRRCQSACAGLELDASRLCQLLIDEGDPGWTTLPAVTRWAQLIQEKGWPA